MKRIALSQGRFALIDDEDFASISKHKWTLFSRNRGSVATCYAYRKEGNKTILMHRQLLSPGNQIVDHVNGNGLDNRRHNLRLCSHQQNSWNSKTRGGTSKYKGVHWCSTRRRWIAKLRDRDGKMRYAGVFKDEQLAARAYDHLAKKLRGSFARLNRQH